jgi:hypothetical protein
MKRGLNNQRSASIAIAKSFFLLPLTLTLSPRRGERGKEEETFAKPYKMGPARHVFWPRYPRRLNVPCHPWVDPLWSLN